MKFGSREICDVVFKAKENMTLGKNNSSKYYFKKGQPVLYIDSAKTTSIEGAAESVYAQGGKGNPRLITWEGDKTLTLTVEDALLSPVSFAMLSGAGLFGGAEDGYKKVHVHKTGIVSAKTVSGTATLDLTDIVGSLEDGTELDTTSTAFAIELSDDGDYTTTFVEGTVEAGSDDIKAKFKTTGTIDATKNYFVDFYVLKPGTSVHELVIDAENFAGYYYVEASTLFRKQATGKDLPAEITFPNVKIQSNFTFEMASSGDPSTFTFTMDAMPGYTLFNTTKKVLCAIQIIDEKVATTSKEQVMNANTSTPYTP